MSTPWVVGPVSVYLAAQNGAASSAIYVGVGKQAPSIGLTNFFNPVHSDYSGMRSQQDDCDAGWSAEVSVDLVQTVPAALEIIKGGALSVQGGALVAPANPGSHPFGSRGTLMQAEGKGFCLFLNFPLVAVKQPLYAGRPLGYRFPYVKSASVIMPPHDMAAESITRINFQCTELMVLSSGLPGWLLYDYAVAGLPPMN